MHRRQSDIIVSGLGPLSAHGLMPFESYSVCHSSRSASKLKHPVPEMARAAVSVPKSEVTDSRLKW